MRRCATTALLGFLLLAACGEEAVPTAADLRLQGERYGQAGEWARAAEAYRLAYAQVDPVPGRAEARADLAVRRGRALVLAGQPSLGSLWLARAQRLDPTRYDVLYDIARVHDGAYPELVDPDRAKEYYEHFLRAYEASGRPEALEGLATNAKARLAGKTGSVDFSPLREAVKNQPTPSSPR